jgi:hypothetical protein
VSRFWRQKIPCWTRLEALGRPGGLANRQGIFHPAEQLYVGGNRNGTRGSADVIIIRIIRWEIPNRIDFIFWSDFGKVDPRVGEFLIQNVQSRSAGLYADCCLGGSLGSRRAKELESDSERNSSRMGGIKSILDLLKSALWLCRSLKQKIPSWLGFALNVLVAAKIQSFGGTNKYFQKNYCCSPLVTKSLSKIHNDLSRRNDRELFLKLD